MQKGIKQHPQMSLKHTVDVYQCFSTWNNHSLTSTLTPLCCQDLITWLTELFQTELLWCCVLPQKCKQTAHAPCCTSRFIKHTGGNLVMAVRANNHSGSITQSSTQQLRWIYLMGWWLSKHWGTEYDTHSVRVQKKLFVRQNLKWDVAVTDLCTKLGLIWNKSSGGGVLD